MRTRKAEIFMRSATGLELSALVMRLAMTDRFGSKADITTAEAGWSGRTFAIGQSRTVRSQPHRRRAADDLDRSAKRTVLAPTLAIVPAGALHLSI